MMSGAARAPRSVSVEVRSGWSPVGPRPRNVRADILVEADSIGEHSTALYRSVNAPPNSTDQIVPDRPQ